MHGMQTNSSSRFEIFIHMGDLDDDVHTITLPSVYVYAQEMGIM